MKKWLLALVLSLTCITCVDYIQPKKSSAQYGRYFYGPIICGEGWYCPKARWDNDCYVRTHCKQEVCDRATGFCRINSWWN